MNLVNLCFIKCCFRTASIVLLNSPNYFNFTTQIGNSNGISELVQCPQHLNLLKSFQFDQWVHSHLHSINCLKWQHSLQITTDDCSLMHFISFTHRSFSAINLTKSEQAHVFSFAQLASYDCSFATRVFFQCYSRQSLFFVNC